MSLSVIERFTSEDFDEIDDEETPQAEALGKILMDLYDPRSVLDVGCATGLYLAPFHKEGIKVKGIESETFSAERSGLRIPREFIVSGRYPDVAPFPASFDLVLCLEVLEHVPEEAASEFIWHLCKEGDTIIFSAAQPGQGGKGHINCQSKTYWVELFRENEFYLDLESAHQIIDRLKEGPHMGWLVNNLMVFKRILTTSEMIDSHIVEKMNVDPNTGGMKASKAAKESMIDPLALEVLAEVAGMGAEKYPHEVIVTDPETGGQKASKQLMVGSIDPAARAELGRVAAYGATKYSRGNYLKGYAWSLSVDALHRHLLAFESGEDYDDESGCLHIIHAAWHCLALGSFKLHNLGTDDRFTYD